MASTHHLPNWKIAVVGSGAMGCFYGGLLANRGREGRAGIEKSEVRIAGLADRSLEAANEFMATWRGQIPCL